MYLRLFISDCGQSQQPLNRITGGQDAGLNEYPWQAEIQTLQDGLWTYLCGGSIILDSWIITSAYCMFNMTPFVGSERRNASDIRVILGEHDISTSEESESIQMEVER